MLAMNDSEPRRQAGGKRQRGGGKKRVKHDKGQKKAMLVMDKELEEKEVILKEELNIQELMPVQYKPEEHHELHATEVHFDPTTMTEQECQTVALNMDSVQNSNKFVIITLLEPGAQGITGEEYVHAEEIIDDSDKSKGTKIQKKVILLHKIDPQPVETIETVTEATAEIIKDDKNEYDNQLMTINFSDFDSTGTENKEQKDLSNWVERFPSLQLFYTESGKPFVKCPACTAMFFKGASFEKHISSHLSKNEERYMCNYCRCENEDPNEIFTHMVIHQDQCEICNINLTRRNNFKKHWDYAELSTTFNARRDRWGRFVCVYCKLGFDLCHQLQKHWFKHSCTGQKTVQCQNCAALFDNEEALGNHVCLKCPVCGKILDSVHRLRSHCRYEKHYLYCEICLYEFILSVDHEKHMQLHKKIYNSHKDYAHCLESDDGSSFQCELCGKIYHTMSCLVLHINDDHKMPENSRPLNDEELARIGIPEDKDETASYDIITTLKHDLKCGVDFDQACEEVLIEDKSNEKAGGSQNQGECRPVALSWNRYTITTNQSDINKDT